jgi:hypothetical protein
MRIIVASFSQGSTVGVEVTKRVGVKFDNFNIRNTSFMCKFTNFRVEDENCKGEPLLGPINRFATLEPIEMYI